MNKLTYLTATALAAGMLAACEPEGPAERAGEAIDNAADNIADAGDDIGNEIEDACEELKEGSGAKDTDC